MVSNDALVPTLMALKISLLEFSAFIIKHLIRTITDLIYVTDSDKVLYADVYY